MTQETGLDDVTEALSVMPHFTHFQGESQARLDRAYVSLDLVPLCNSYDVKYVSFTDHSLVAFNLGKKEKKPLFSWDLWKFNAQLLEDEQFVIKVKQNIDLLLSGEPGNWFIRWEDFKEAVKISALKRARAYAVINEAKKTNYIAN